MISRKILNLFVMFCLIGLVTLSSCSQNSTTTKLIEKRIDAESVTDIAIGNANGDIEIRAWEQGSVYLTARVITSGVTGGDAIAELKNIAVEAIREGNIIRIKADRINKNKPLHSVVSMVIYIPHNRNLEAATGVGNITLHLPVDSGFSLNAAAAVGKVNCQFDFTGDMTDTQLNGSAGIAPAFRVILGSGVGDITILQQPVP